MITKSSGSLGIVVGLRLATSLMCESLISLVREPTLRLLNHKDPSVRKAAWNCLRSIRDNSPEDSLPLVSLREALGREEHLEVINGAIKVVLRDDRLVEERVGALRETLLTSERISAFGEFHPILLGQLVTELSDEQALLLSPTALTQIIKERPSLVAHHLCCDAKLMIIERSLASSKPNQIFAGLSLLGRIIEQLGERISNLQGPISRCLANTDHELAFMALQALLKVPNASNWEHLVSLALSLLERTAHEEETYFWSLKIQRRLLEIILEYCHAEERQATHIERIIALYGERTSLEDIMPVKALLAGHPVLERAHPPANRVAILVGFRPKNDQDLDVRRHLLEEEIEKVAREENAPFGRMQSSIFYQIPPMVSGADSSSSSSSPAVSPLSAPEASSQAKSSIPLSSHSSSSSASSRVDSFAGLPPELMMDIFSGFHKGGEKEKS